MNQHRCLCCGEILDPKETETGWHRKCIREFFGTEELPKLKIRNADEEQTAQKSLLNGIGVPGVQKKLPLHLLLDSKNPRLMAARDPTGYMLKPDSVEYPYLPIYEHLTMKIAEIAGIQTVPHALIDTGESLAYITRRVDRVFPPYLSVKPVKTGMEDFCQLSRRRTADKYRGSYEQCAKVIAKYSEQPMPDLASLYTLLLFCFISGNSDMHLKNFSLLETEAGSGTYRLSPAYDLLPVNLVLPSDKEQLAMPLNGKKQNLKRGDFIKFAIKIGLTKTAAEKLIDEMISRKELFFSEINHSLLPQSEKEKFKDLIFSRIQMLQPAAINT